jgi:large subunit ribosomal protein L10
MARPEKVSIVDEIAEKIERTQSLFLTDFSGLDVESINELRRLLRENAVEYRVVKNTLARLAVDKAGREDLKPFLVGPTAMAFGFEDPILPAKLLSQFAQKTGKPSVKAILFENQVYGQETMDRLKTLPSHEELLSKAVSGLKAPITQVVLVLGSLLRNLLGLLEAISQAKGADATRMEGESAETKAEQKAEMESEVEPKEGAQAEVQEETEEKSGEGGHDETGEKAEEEKEVEEQPGEESTSQPVEKEPSAMEPEGLETKKVDIPEEEVRPEEKSENEKKNNR